MKGNSSRLRREPAPPGKLRLIHSSSTHRRHVKRALGERGRQWTLWTNEAALHKVDTEDDGSAHECPRFAD